MANPRISKGPNMYRSLGAAALLAIAIAAPVEDAAAQDPVGGAILGGATGAAVAAQGQARPGGYRYYQRGCYQQRADGGWVVVAPEYCGPPVAAAPPPVAMVRDELSDRMLGLRIACEDGDRRACVRLGIIIGENRERRASWRREHPEVFFYER
jgi:hypothetical protein